MPPGGLSDEQLVEGCLKRDSDCWDRFVERFSKLVHWSIRKSADLYSVENRDEFCREVYQEFFERLIEKDELSKLRDVSSLRKYLSVMACHLTMDKQKASSRRSKRAVSLDEEMAQIGQAVPMNNDAEFDESRGVIEQSLAALKEKERACLELRVLKGMTAAEIGALLGISADTVGSTIRRVKEKLRKKLSQKGLNP